MVIGDGGPAPGRRGSGRGAWPQRRGRCGRPRPLRRHGAAEGVADRRGQGGVRGRPGAVDREAGVGLAAQRPFGEADIAAGPADGVPVVGGERLGAGAAAGRDHVARHGRQAVGADHVVEGLGAGDGPAGLGEGLCDARALVAEAGQVDARVAEGVRARQQARRRRPGRRGPSATIPDRSPPSAAALASGAHSPPGVARTRGGAGAGTPVGASRRLQPAGGDVAPRPNSARMLSQWCKGGPRGQRDQAGPPAAKAPSAQRSPSWAGQPGGRPPRSGIPLGPGSGGDRGWAARAGGPSALPWLPCDEDEDGHLDPARGAAVRLEVGRVSERGAIRRRPPNLGRGRGADRERVSACTVFPGRSVQWPPG